MSETLYFEEQQPVELPIRQRLDALGLVRNHIGRLLITSTLREEF